jgi:hypothetical protein
MDHYGYFHSIGADRSIVYEKPVPGYALRVTSEASVLYIGIPHILEDYPIIIVSNGLELALLHYEAMYAFMASMKSRGDITKNVNVPARTIRPDFMSDRPQLCFVSLFLADLLSCMCCMF